MIEQTMQYTLKTLNLKALLIKQGMRDKLTPNLQIILCNRRKG